MPKTKAASKAKILAMVKLTTVADNDWSAWR